MRKNIIRAIAFCLIVAVLVLIINDRMYGSEPWINYSKIRGIYVEPKDTIDVVYIGASTAYSSFCPLLAYDEYGYTSYVYACQCQPFDAALYMIKEVRKTQRNPVFIINMNSVWEDLNTHYLHCLFDYIPFSKNKLDLIQDFTPNHDWFGRIEFMFPLLRYHSRWDSLSSEDLLSRVDGFKGSSVHESFLSNTVDITEQYHVCFDKENPKEVSIQRMNSLFEYIDKEGLNVVFVVTPHYGLDDDSVAIRNSMVDIVREHGYPVIDMYGDFESTGLDLTEDYYNDNHTNIHGAIKITRLLSDTLKSMYDLPDHRNDLDYKKWNKCRDEYYGIIEPYIGDRDKLGIAH